MTLDSCLFVFFCCVFGMKTGLKMDKLMRVVSSFRFRSFFKCHYLHVCMLMAVGLQPPLQMNIDVLYLPEEDILPSIFAFFL